MEQVDSACNKIIVKFCALYMLNIEKLVAPFDTPNLNLNLINMQIIGKIDYTLHFHTIATVDNKMKI